MTYSPDSTVSLRCYFAASKSKHYFSTDTHNHFSDPSRMGLDDLFKEYRSVLFNSLITTFGLDSFLFRDIDGGNVQTMHNAKNKVYANEEFRERGERQYKRDDYATANYMNARRKQDFQQNEKIVDGYTGKDLPKDGRAHLEHVVSAKENHDNVEMRILFSKNGMHEIVNDKNNTIYTDSSLNMSKSDSSLGEWKDKPNRKNQDKTNAEAFELDEKMATKVDKNARKVIEEKVARKKMQHYAGSIASDSIKQGGKLAVRQALGVVLTEAACCLIDEVPQIMRDLKQNFSIEQFFEKMAKLVGETFNRIKLKFKAVWDALGEGFFSGIFTSITTAVVNMFLTTAKNVVTLIRQCFVSITAALKVLILNPDKLSAGERTVAALKILLTGASAVLGVIANQAVSDILSGTGIAAIPLVGEVLVDVIPAFIGTLLTGIMTVTVLHYMDHSPQVQQLIEFINNFVVDKYASAVNAYKDANAKIDRYISELMAIDLDFIKDQGDDLEQINRLADSDPDVFASVLFRYHEKYHVDLQFHSFNEFDQFMSDKDNVLVL